MPATRSRISASSSTIRMSVAIACALFCRGGQDRLVLVFAFDGEPEAHQCAATTRRHRRRVEELDAAAMFFHDLADDREAEAGALLARGDIRLEQPLPILL